MIRYPNGTSDLTIKKEKKLTTVTTAANRGMGFEDEINISNLYYNNQNIALITKRPTPINIVKVDYSKGARITDAYFEHQSTTDYNGVYKGRYLDFEAKSSKSKTSFPLGNISVHQIKHLKGVIAHGGIAFFILNFEMAGE
ncbi:MAG: Holliday junction resolvase RecU, partial [Firmicutes bacterium]|nr:Holliday junction resolvase RecU [Bacillota bacterium]